MRNMHSIFGALPIVAASYGDDMGVKVRIGGSDAYTTGDLIVVPHLDVKSDERLKDVLWGYLSHEAAHIKHTDIDAYLNCVNSLPPVGQRIANLIEDVWIENALIKELPGTRFTMDKTMDYVVSKGKEEETEDDGDLHPAEVIRQYLWVWLRCVYREQKSLQNDLDKIRRVFDKTFPKPLCNDLENMIRQRMPGVNSTKKANQLTTDILDLVEQHIPPEEPPEDQQQQQQNQSNQQGSGQSGQGADDDESGDDQSDGQSQTSDSGPNGNDDEGQQDGSDGGNQSQNQSGQDSGSNSQFGQDKDDSNSSQSGSGVESDDSDQSQSQSGGGAGNSPKNDACQQALNASADDLDDDLGEKLKSILEANADPNADSSAMPEMSYDTDLFRMGNVNEINDGVLHASKLRAKLTGLVQSQQLRRSYETASGQHINSRRIDRVLSGDLRIFSHDSPRRQVNTDVCLLLDSSTSMSDYGRHTICNSATASLALALGDIRGVDVCAATFPGADSCVGPLNYLGNPVRKNLGRFQINPHGGTPLAEALLWSIKELRKGRRERKVVLVLSDGEPFDTRIVKNLINQMEQSGIQMVGIGIQTNAIAKYFRENIVINNLNDLGPKLFEVARRLV